VGPSVGAYSGVWRLRRLPPYPRCPAGLGA